MFFVRLFPLVMTFGGRKEHSLRKGFKKGLFNPYEVQKNTDGSLLNTHASVS